ncbi:MULTISPECIES: PadR family transcriptional regulator [unclassified Streptomyces]|uniref:PadR family transcriptional regulator n=1 Tax=unclassified Streptomyces TaxID=2593676 RepID=UPI0033282954
MSLPHAILTALLESPSSGLELTRKLDRSADGFWSATHQQVYRELGRLEQAGLIHALPRRRSTRGQKKEYEVLPAGRAELADWVSERQDPQPVRDSLLLRLRAAAVVGARGLDDELRRHFALHQRQLSEYTELEKRDFKGEHAGEAEALRHLVLRARISVESFWIQWLTEAIVTVEQLDPEQDRAQAAPRPTGGQRLISWEESYEGTRE